MSETKAFSHPIRVADLRSRKVTRFDLQPTPDELEDIAADIGADALRKVRMKGELRPMGRNDWELQADLGATAVQPCTVTLAPVATRIEEQVVRRWLRDMPEPEGDEVEMPEDDTLEPLGPVIDLGAVLTEALALALPLYPRVEDAALEETVFTEPGKAPLRDGEVRPFASLASLRDKLATTNGETPAKERGEDES